MASASEEAPHTGDTDPIEPEVEEGDGLSDLNGPRTRRRRRRSRRGPGVDDDQQSSTGSQSQSERFRGGKPPDPPVYTGEPQKDNAQDPFGFKTYVQKVRVYQRRVAPYLPPNEQALALYQALEGRAAEQLNDLNLDTIDVESGIDVL